MKKSTEELRKEYAEATAKLEQHRHKSRRLEKQIIVYAPEKSSARRTQKVRIIFNFLDELDMPEISEPVVTETAPGRRKTA